MSCAAPPSCPPSALRPGVLGAWAVVTAAGGFLRLRQGWASELARSRSPQRSERWEHRKGCVFKLPLFSRRVRSPRGGEKQNQENR